MKKEDVATIRDKKEEKRIHGLIKRMAKEIGIRIPKRDYPRVFKTYLSEHNLYNYDENILSISSEDLYSGVVIGEEAGHFIRGYMQKNKRDKKETHTDEFFGCLGRKILQRIEKPEDRLYFYLDRKLPSRKDIIKILKKDKQAIKNWEQIIKTGNYPRWISPEQAKKNKEKLMRERKDKLKHWRPYYFAQRTDLDKANLKKLYSLSNKDIRMRFFRENPDYGESGPKRKSILEQLVKVIAIPFTFLILLMIIKVSMTGSVIGELYVDNKIQILGLVIVLLFIVLVIYKNKLEKN